MPHGAEHTPGMFAWMDGVEAGIADKLDKSEASSTYAPLALQARATLKKAQTVAMTTAAGAGAPRLKVMCFGDSYATKLIGSCSPQIANVLGRPAVGNFGSGEFLMAISLNSNTGAVQNTTDFTRWPTGATTTLTGGATITYGSVGSVVVADVWTVYYIKEPGGGTFKVQTDDTLIGGPVTDVPGFTNIDTSNATVTLGIAYVTTTRAYHELKLVNLTGTVRVLFTPHMSDSTQPGIEFLNVSQSGILLSDALSTPAAVANLQAFITDQAPDLITYEMSELDNPTFAANVATLLATFRAGSATADIIGIGSPPIATNDAARVAENAVLKAACAAAGAMYFDTHDLFGTEANLTLAGWQGDGVHCAVEADAFRGAKLLQTIGLTMTPTTGLAYSMLRPDANVRTLDVTGRIAFPRYVTGARPDPAGLPNGICVYDNTLHIPIWLDASAGWRNAAGVLV